MRLGIDRMVKCGLYIMEWSQIEWIC